MNTSTPCERVRIALMASLDGESDPQSAPDRQHLSTCSSCRRWLDDQQSMTGHLLGAAGGLEAGITALAVKHQLIPPTINYENPDPECDLDYVPNTKRAAKIDYALSNSFGFGGTNGALLFKKFDE